MGERHLLNGESDSAAKIPAVVPLPPMAGPAALERRRWIHPPFRLAREPSSYSPATSRAPLVEIRICETGCPSSRRLL